jgi:sugar lactone lactonase YvrE
MRTHFQKVILYSKTSFKRSFRRFLVYKNKSESKLYIISFYLRFCEPGGLCLSEDESILYIADTNNHCIKHLNLDSGEVETLNIKFPGLAQNMFQTNQYLYYK